ncbi:hypothetical protein ABE236_25330 [Priestia endophytica]|uniref:hypothetical protein n=1 Tax=Priestia endophytica TaxID=135735 RepID=UPI003D2899B3
MSNPKTYFEEYEETFNEFLRNTAGEGILQMVLRTHLYIEHELENIIKDTFVKPELLLNNRSMFSNKLSLVTASGIIPSEFYGSLKYFNKLRNSYAHNLKFELTEGDLAKLIDSFDEVVKEIYEMFKKELLNIPISDENIFRAEVRITMATLLTSVKRHYALYLGKSLEDEFSNLNKLAEILEKGTEQELRDHLSEKLEDIIERMSYFSGYRGE